MRSRSLWAIVVLALGAGACVKPMQAPPGSNGTANGGNGNGGNGNTTAGSGTNAGNGPGGGSTGVSPGGGPATGCNGSCDGGTHAGPPGKPTGPSGSARLVAYVNCLCGFGTGTRSGECLAAPDPAVNQVKQWEDGGVSPITHYVLSFLSFSDGAIQSDPGEIWANNGGSTSDFTLQPNLRDAMRSAQMHGKKIMLSLGGQAGSSGFLDFWQSCGSSTGARVSAMRTKLAAVAQAFATQNAITVDGFDIDIELGAVYGYNSDKYAATRDLINAIPDGLIAAFVPQVGNGLCAAPVQNDPLNPQQTMGGQCQQPNNGDDSSWVLARLDKECTRADGSPRLDYWGIQYYNAGQATCCGGGTDDASAITSIFQNYKNLANGWPASGDLSQASNPWHAYQFYPGSWPAFAGIGADRLVLGKPGCQGCAGSDYLDMGNMQKLIGQLDHQLVKPMGGILFWDLCRLFGSTGTQCVAGTCQPSWGGDMVLANLQQLQQQMSALKTH